MHQAAKGLRAAAATKPSPKGNSRMAKAVRRVRPPRARRSPRPARGDAHLAELKDAIKARTGRNWGELPGHLRSEILQMSQGKYRDDYARLIQLYFREIAAGRDETIERKGKP